MNDSTARLSDLSTLVSTFCDERDWRRYHDLKSLSMAIAVEAAELMEHFRWARELEFGPQSPSSPRSRAIEEELADVLFLVLEFAVVAQVDLTRALVNKLEINRQRYPIEKSRGRSDKYTEL